jgi:hypothetical protein
MTSNPKIDVMSVMTEMRGKLPSFMTRNRKEHVRITTMNGEGEEE